MSFIFCSGKGGTLINKKALIEEAAHHTFKELGYKKTNISKITERAGIATGSFYKYYDSKEDIFLQVYIQENNQLRERIKSQIDWQGDPITIIEALFRLSHLEQVDNKIMAEWNNEAINHLMKDYYNSDQGRKEYPFHHFLLETFQTILIDLGYSDSEIKKLIQVYELFYALDTKMDKSNLPHFNESLQVLAEYFIRGIISQKK
ncbi:TetR/AcrR family transcriptional regulator [Facklamia sp. DSM 111019]|nr:TetR/AcrR family transcriptional regulator [Facklamia lactis]